MPSTAATLALLSLATTSLAQAFGNIGFGGSSDSGNPYSNSGGNDGNDGQGGGGGGDFAFGPFNLSHYSMVLTVHAVLATLAFGFLLPVGGILIRLGSSPNLWLIHGLLQCFAYLIYIAAFGIGIWMVSQRSQLINNAHPIIGIALLILILFQPISGFLHHALFKKHSRRVVWSYAHIWLGRIAITLGIINGGLGLRYSQQFPLAPPSNGAIIAYGVLAGLMWLLYVASIIIGERRRSQNAREISPPRHKATHRACKTQYA